VLRLLRRAVRRADNLAFANFYCGRAADRPPMGRCGEVVVERFHDLAMVSSTRLIAVIGRHVSRETAFLDKGIGRRPACQTNDVPRGTRLRGGAGYITMHIVGWFSPYSSLPRRLPCPPHAIRNASVEASRLSSKPPSIPHPSPQRRQTKPNLRPYRRLRLLPRLPSA